MRTIAELGGAPHGILVFSAMTAGACHQDAVLLSTPPISKQLTSYHYYHPAILRASTPSAAVKNFPIAAEHLRLEYHRIPSPSYKGNFDPPQTWICCDFTAACLEINGGYVDAAGGT
jgi:hypothetical protein